jgi:uncharacterized membrane protein
MEDWIFADGHGQLTFRWAHLLAGVIWIGILYFFNWINGHFAATLDAETKRKVVPELMPRALYWFRWGAAWTWLTGVALLFVMYYIRDTGHFLAVAPLEGENKPTPAQWGKPFALLFVGFLVYDNLFKLVGSKSASLHSVCVVIWGALAVGFYVLMTETFGMSARAGLVHVGALFGTSMAANVWMRIWPAQQRIIMAIKNGEAPDGADAGLAGSRSKHNTYMSVPLLFLMISVDQGKALSLGAVGLAAVLAVSWLVTYGLYKKSATVKGF